MGYTKPFILLIFTAICNIHNYTPINTASHYVHIVVYYLSHSQRRSTNWFPWDTVSLSPADGLVRLEQHCDDHSEPSNNGSHTGTDQNSQSGKHTNQYHPPHGYGHYPSQTVFPSTSQLSHNSPSSMTHDGSQDKGHRLWVNWERLQDRY